MKVTREKQDFKPITLTLESEFDLRILRAVVSVARDAGTGLNSEGLKVLDDLYTRLIQES